MDGLDVFRMFEAYYARSEQYPARFFTLGPERYGLVRALPNQFQKNKRKMRIYLASDIELKWRDIMTARTGSLADSAIVSELMMRTSVLTAPSATCATCAPPPMMITRDPKICPKGL